MSDGKVLKNAGVPSLDPCAQFAVTECLAQVPPQANRPSLRIMVPDEGIEPPTFGLQNRCSTAELIRPLRHRNSVPIRYSIRSGAR